VPNQASKSNIVRGAHKNRRQQYDNISLLFLPPYSPELNPKENLWDEIREKIFKNYALKSIDAVRAKLKQAILYIERNTKIVQSITSFPYIATSL
jgi:transposase